MFSGIRDKISQYVGNHLQLLQLNAVEKGAKVLGFVSYGSLLLFILMLVLVLLGMGLGEFYSIWFGSKGWGFFAASATFILLLFVLISLKKKILRSLVNLFIGVLSDDVESNDHTAVPASNNLKNANETPNPSTTKVE